MNRTVITRLSMVLLLTAITTNNSKSQTGFIWGKQLGSDKDEYSFNHVIDQKGNIYVAGKTTGAIGAVNAGKNDGFLIKIDSLGNTLWSKQFGTAEEEDIQWSAIDNNSNIYITGTTTGDLKEKNSGKEDIIVVKYHPDGELEWSKQFGTEASDVAKGIFADKSGNIYVTGMTEGTLGKSSMGKADCFIMKLDKRGNQIFITQFGTPLDDYSYAITGGPGSDIYVCGSTWGDIGSKNKGFIDGFTGQFTDKGDNIKYYQFGSKDFDIAMNLVVDKDNNIYTGGTTGGNFGGTQVGEGDCFLLKINDKGVILWNNQFGTTKNDGLRSIVLNPEISDNILVSGVLNLPPAHAFIKMYQKDGSLLWERSFIGEGKNGDTSGKDVNLDDKGNFYHLGLTGTNMFGNLIGMHDMYLVKCQLDKRYWNH